MNAKNVRINLPYDQADLKSLLRYAKAHDVELDGRYDIRKPPRLNIWTHTWIHPGCRAESSLMFSLEFDWNTASLVSVIMQPGYDWSIFLDELAVRTGHVGRGRVRKTPGRADSLTLLPDGGDRQRHRLHLTLTRCSCGERITTRF